MEYSTEVKKLAETLKNSGLVASMADALERAQSMLGKKEVIKEPEAREEPFKKIDSAQTTLDEAKESEEINEPEEALEVEEQKIKGFLTSGYNDSEELKKEEVFVNKTNIEQKKEETEKG